VADRWATSVAALTAAIVVGERRPVRFRSELAEAHAGLGLAALPTGPRARGAHAAYVRARTEYQKAVILTDDDARKRTFSSIIAYIDRRLLLTGG
jgi:hypothetical protein